MIELQNKLKHLLDKGVEGIYRCSEHNLTFKASPEKWSKKEILGHLIDSGINNLQRFTEIQFTQLPYKIRTYSQDELVIANDYHNSKISELVDFWKAINHRILHLFNTQTETTLNYKIVFDDGERSDLKFLMEDYVNHLEYHLNQILVL